MRCATFSSKRRALVGLAFLVLAVAARAENGNLLASIDREVSALFEKSRDAVVKVHAERVASAGNLVVAPARRCGTGFFIDLEGRLLTAATVIEAADRCWIEWRGHSVPARVVGRDALTNLALLQVDPASCGGDIPALPMGDSGSLRVGSMLIAIGFPYEMPSAPAVGFVSGFDITCGARTFPVAHIRSSCRLSPGQAGAPLLDVKGAVVGIAVAAHNDDHCLVLPIKAALKVCDDIRQFGQPRHARVGLAVMDRLVPGAAAHWQVSVRQVLSNSPAASAGFLAGDVLLRVSTNDIRRASDVLDVMFAYRPGDRLSFTVLRDGNEREISVVADARPAEPSQTAQPVSSRRLPQIVPASGIK
jgi:serine protease Do